jgi:hypothetical protein
MDEQRLRPPQQRQRPIPRSANVEREPTPEQLARLNLLRRIKRARLVMPEDLARYVGRHLVDADTIASEALEISSIEDLRAYQTLITLALRSHRAGGVRRDDPIHRMLRGFRIELKDGGTTTNEYLQSPCFILYRTRKAA